MVITTCGGLLFSTGQITNSAERDVVVDYNIINVGKTTIYPADLYIPPAQAVWNPRPIPPAVVCGMCAPTGRAALVRAT